VSPHDYKFVIAVKTDEKERIDNVREVLGLRN
jgi:hypothetical protein